MLRYSQILEESNKLSNIVGTYAESAVPKTEGKYMGEREHLLQAEIYLRKFIQELEYAERYSQKVEYPIGFNHKKEIKLATLK